MAKDLGIWDTLQIIFSPLAVAGHLATLVLGVLWGSWRDDVRS